MTLHNSDIIFPQLHMSAVLNHFIEHIYIYAQIHTYNSMNHIAVFNNNRNTMTILFIR